MSNKKPHTVWLNDEDWELLSNLASASGRSISSYVRTLIHFKRPKKKQGNDWKKAYRELSLIGNNLNQIARYCHLMKKIDESMLKDCINVIYKVQSEMRKEILPEDM